MNFYRASFELAQEEEYILTSPYQVTHDMKRNSIGM